MKTTTQRKGNAKMKTGLLALALAGAAVSGCGQTSYFEVSLDITPDPGSSCLTRIYTCTVSVMGADSGYFNLDDRVCHAPTSTNLGLFQFSTEKDSGNVNFKVQIVNVDLKPLGAGTGSGAIKAGGRQAVQIHVTPDDAALTAEKCKIGQQ